MVAKVPTPPTFGTPTGTLDTDEVIQAQVRSLLAAEPLRVQDVTVQLRHHYPAERVIAVVTDMIRSGRVHMSETYPMRLRLRF